MCILNFFFFTNHFLHYLPQISSAKNHLATLIPTVEKQYFILMISAPHQSYHFNFVEVIFYKFRLSISPSSSFYLKYHTLKIATVSFHILSCLILFQISKFWPYIFQDCSFLWGKRKQLFWFWFIFPDFSTPVNVKTFR